MLNFKLPIMKNLKYLLLITVMYTLGGCTKFDDDINENPSRPKTVSNSQLLQYSMRQLAGTVETPFGELYIQHLSEKEYSDAQRYNTITFNFAGWYADPLMNLQQIIDATSFNVTEGSENNQKAVARILKAYFMWHITDRWGDVPYSEALMGEKELTPKYDTQKDIYYGLMNELREAAAMIDNGLGVQGDLIYAGDMNKWKKLANSVRMLMALRLSKIDPEKGKTEFNEAMTAGVFTSNADNFIYKHLAEAANENYWYNVFVTLSRKWYAISKPLVDYMQPYGDPRLPTFADKNETGNYVGMPYGLVSPQTVPAGTISFLGSGLRQQASPNYLVTYAQILFAKAEAAHPSLAWISGGDATAKTNYDMAIEQSVRQWNNDNITGLSAMMANAGIVYNSATAIRQIAYQRWVHLYLNGYEAWAEWRRTGFPTLTPAPDNNNRPIPRREGYPPNEALINTANFNEAVQRLGGVNDLNTRVWWDKP
jgi:hypothetical protein